MPLISVIVPVYKTEAYLPRCLDSLLNQTLKDIEIILVDDGSPDNSGKICDEYAARHPNIQVLHNENAGSSLARISGMRAASGKYLAFLDSDDWVTPDAFAPMVAQAETHQADIVIAGFIRDYGTRLEPYSNKIPSGVYRDNSLSWLFENGIFHLDSMEQAQATCVWNKLFRKDTMLEPLLQAKAKISFAEDVLLCYSALFASRCVVVMNEHQQIRYQIREGSITNSYYKYYMRDINIAYDRLIEIAIPVQSEKMLTAIAYFYIALYLGGIYQEMSHANPASRKERQKNIRTFSQDDRLRKCLERVDLNRYPKETGHALQLLAKGRYRSYLATYTISRIWLKIRSIIKKVIG